MIIGVIIGEVTQIICVIVLYIEYAMNLHATYKFQRHKYVLSIMSAMNESQFNVETTIKLHTNKLIDNKLRSIHTTELSKSLGKVKTDLPCRVYGAYCAEHDILGSSRSHRCRGALGTRSAGCGRSPASALGYPSPSSACLPRSVGLSSPPPTCPRRSDRRGGRSTPPCRRSAGSPQ